MDFKVTKLKREFALEGVVTVHYFECHKDYMFSGERHDFWELLYVDKGEVAVRADDRTIVMRKGETIFHAPDEFHMVVANGVTAPNLVVIAFHCRSCAMERFRGALVALNEDCKKYMGHIVSEARNAFTTPLDDPGTKEMSRRPGAKFGCEQLIGVYLELLLISVARNDPASAASSPIHQRQRDAVYVRIIKYLEENLGGDLTLLSIAEHFAMSVTGLKTLFREHNDLGVMEYLRLLRVERAKQLIREESMNFTEISGALGFSSIHYFSRAFKRTTGMTPSEYATSVKALIEYHPHPQ